MDITSRRLQLAALVLLLVLLILVVATMLLWSDNLLLSAAGPAVSDPQSPPAARLLVDEAGLYRVSAADLRAAGADLLTGDATGLTLMLAGEPVSFVLEEGDSERNLLFYGLPRESRYGRDNVYWLRRTEETELAVQPSEPASIPSADGETRTDFQRTLRLEENIHYLSQTPEGSDHWLWEPIYAPGSFAVPFDLPLWTGGDALITATLWANTQGQPDPDHHALLRVNGERVAELSWDGKDWKTLSGPIAASALREQGNELTVELPGDTGAVVEVIYLNRVEISYPRRLAVEDGRLLFAAPAGQTVTVNGLDSLDVALWDVTGGTETWPLSGFELAAGADRSGTLRFRAGEGSGQRRYALTTAAGWLAPKSIEAVTSRDLRDNPAGADYIAIAAPGFVDALQPLLDFRREQGLRVTVATIDEVYDTFSAGLLDPAAIRDYMLYARANWPEPAPRFLLLVGDASYDYQGFLPDSTPNFVPTYLLSTHFVGETASDNWFVSIEGEDDQPDMAVGRIPAQTAEQVKTAVAKTLAYENASDAGDWAGRALFVADDKQENFQTISDELAADFLPASYEVDKVYLGQTDDANEEILADLREGVGLVTYVGHGSMNVWAQEKIFQISDVSGLDNASALPFMMTMTCLVGYFHHPQATSMGEELLFKTDGGVVAAFVPTSESLANDQQKLAESIYTHLFGDAETVGEAIMLGKQDLISDHFGMQDLIETFVLLGDPALRLRAPGENN